MGIKRILHASDFSPASRPAFKLAQELARTFGAELILFHAHQPFMPMAAEGPISPTAVERIFAASREAAGRRLQVLAKSAKRGGVRVSTLLAEGAAAPSIVRAAKRKRAGLVVLGTHGRTGVRRMLLGSVAERVVRTAPCPVLTVGTRRR